jgi:hypothetical protein
MLFRFIFTLRKNIIKNYDTIFITHFITKFAVKHVINESLDNIKIIIKEASVEALSKYHFMVQNR